MTEWGSGSDAFALATRAVDRGDHFELTGNKAWITNAHEAGTFVVFATIDPALGYRGITAFIVERTAPGVSVGTPEDKVHLASHHLTSHHIASHRSTLC